MKPKKIISTVIALATTVTMFSAFNIAEAASLGGKPSLTIAYDKYEAKSASAIFMYLNVKIDLTAAETLEVFSEVCDDSTDWETVIKGNGVTTLGADWIMPEGFTYNSALSTVPSGMAVNWDATNRKSSIAFGPKNLPAEFWVDPVIEFNLVYKASKNDATGKFDYSGDIKLIKNEHGQVGSFTVDGLNSAESNAVWSYASAEETANIDLTANIPSYESTLAPPTPSVNWVDATHYADYTSKIDNSTAAAYTVEFTGDGTAYDKMTWKVVSGGTTKGCHVNAAIGGEGTSKFGIAIGGLTSEDITSVQAAAGAQGTVAQ